MFESVVRKVFGWTTGKRRQTGHKSATRQLRLETLERRELLAQTVGLFTNTTQAYPGYTLFAPSNGTETFLIDNNGKEINRWNSEFPPMSAYLLEDGSLLRVGRMDTGFFAPGAAGRIELLDWDGDMIWQYTLNNANERQHHDIEPIFDENGKLSSVLMIAWERLTPGESAALGRNPSLNTDRDGELWPDMIIEVKPDFEDGFGGERIWEWRVSDHVTTTPAQNPELININFVPTGEGAGGVRADWTHFNGIDYNPELDQVLISVREFSEIWVVDHSTTTAQARGHSGGDSGMGGDLLYRWGNPQTYGQGSKANQRLFYQHDAKWVEPGLPGEGNITIFNNGWNRQGGANYSSVVEIAPPINHQWYLNNKTDGSSNNVIVFDWMDDVPSSWVPLAGDWDKDGKDTTGLYDPDNQHWYFNDATDGSLAVTEFSTAQFGADDTWIPVTGDWNNDGFDTAGLYDPATKTFYLSNGMTNWSDVVQITAPASDPGTIPLAGNWNGIGGDGIGLYDPSKNGWKLYNTTAAGAVTTVFSYDAGRARPDWKPIAGDWDNDGRDSPGLYDSDNHRWYLNNRTNGPTNDVIVIKAPLVPANWRPIAGDWNGNGTDSVGLYDPTYNVGDYNRLPGAAFGPRKPVWEYTSTPRSNFFATIISGAQRLPNGNTLINEGTEGRFFEVNQNKQIVWSYKNPVVSGNSGMGRALIQGFPVESASSTIGIPGVDQNLVFRAERYGLDYLDASLDVTPGDPVERYPAYFDTVGLYNPETFDWELNNHLDGTRTDIIPFTTGFEGGIPVSGDWDGDGIDTVGLYDPVMKVWYLNNATDGSYEDVPFDTTQPGVKASWIPLAGDWNNDGYDTPGLYDPANNNWYLSDAVGEWGDVTMIDAPTVPASWIPLAGNWDGIGGDSVGLYDPARNRWILNNRIDGLPGGVVDFQIRKAHPTWKPVVGDWNGDGKDGVGLYNPANGRWVLNNNIDGSTGGLITLRTRGFPSSAIPVTGDWNGSNSQNLLLASQTSQAPSVTVSSADNSESTEAAGQPEPAVEESASEGLLVLETNAVEDPPPQVFAASKSQTLGLTVNNPAQSYDGYTVLGPLRSPDTYLINNEGKVVHTWESEYRPNSNYLLEDGTLLRTAQLNLGQIGVTWGAGGSSGRVELLDWDSNVIWSYELANNTYLLHHDIAPILNPDGSLKSVLMIVWHKLTRAEAVALGRNPGSPSDAANNGELWSERIIEVVPDWDTGEGGDIVWDWYLKDHVVSGNVAAHPELVDINFEPVAGNASTLADWAHFNGIDYNPITDQIMISSRDFSELWVLDHSTTTEEAAGHTGGNSGMGGDLLFRWGNPAAYGRGTRATQKLFHQHNAHWIPPGLEGAGNILVYNNGSFRPDGSEFSTVIEIEPPINHQWYFNNKTDGSSNNVVVFDWMSDVPSSWVPLAGDWDKDGKDTAGFYDPENQKWYFNDATVGSPAVTEFSTDQPGADDTWIPVVGDWNNDGHDTVGLFDPATKNWYLSNGTTDWSGVVEITTPASEPDSVPIAGNWDGNYGDGVGLYDPSRNGWKLYNITAGGSVTNGPSFQVRVPHPTWKPITGDWNNNGRDSVGLYDADNHRWYLNNRTDGSINDLIVINAPLVPANWRPFAGDFNGNGTDTVGLYNPKYIDNNFTILPGQAFGPATPVWEYVGRPRNSFYSSIISGAQRLPNGNTLVDEGEQGRLFEVTPGGKIVWEYINPVNQTGPLRQGQTPPDLNPGIKSTLVFRALRYPLDYPAFDGKDLTPGDPVERYPEYADTVGLYDPNGFDWYLNNHLDGTITDIIQFETGFGGAIPVSGDWDGDGIDTVGLYNPAMQEWFLNNATDGSFDGDRFVTTQTGARASWLPITGDWNNDGVDTPGLYNPATNNWYLSDAEGSWGDVTTIIAPADVPDTWIPLAGDWDGIGGDSVGLYNPAQNYWVLNNKIDGTANKEDLIVIKIRKAHPTWKPVIGDWDGNGKDTPGLYNPAKRQWILNNQSDGSINDLVVLRTPGLPVSAIPVTGDWDGSNAPSVSLDTLAAGAGSENANQLTAARLQPVFNEAVRRIKSVSGESAAQTLDDVTVEVVDLPGEQLGRALAGLKLQIDVDAGGAGWFVDLTPADDSEFSASNRSELTASADSPASGRVDLLTVVSHELAHLLGAGHADHGLMQQTLPLGVRRAYEGLDSVQRASDSVFAALTLADLAEGDGFDEIFADVALLGDDSSI